MKLSNISRLCCPICRGENGLSLRAFEEPTDGEVADGILICDGCMTWFPVMGRVPVLLDFTTDFHKTFANRFEGKIPDSHRMPSGQPRPGEASVQETFSDEWDLVQENDLSFSYTADDLIKLHRDVWLGWMDDNVKPASVLNVGCGLGRESAALQDAIGDQVEVYGIDLNFAVLKSGNVYKDRPNLHLIVASLFALPFRDFDFDLVYSQGVIHHTYSTKAAFDSISKHARKDGHIFVWVYGLDDHLVSGGVKGAVTRTMWHVESISRPIISRSPRAIRNAMLAVMTAAAHPIFLQAPSVKRLDGKWEWKNTDHALRDRLSPMFAHRHSFNEVIEWYERGGFDVIDVQRASKFLDYFGRPVWGVGMTGRRTSRDA
ncbi:methyltransferase domain-containing protein [Aliihoeflea sp. PC F10.4]